MTVERFKYIGDLGYICTGCAKLAFGVLLRDEHGVYHEGCYDKRECACCPDKLDPTEAVEHGGLFFHADCLERGQLEAAAASDERAESVA